MALFLFWGMVKASGTRSVVADPISLILFLLLGKGFGNISFHLIKGLSL
jgi:hypothetical protein